MDSIPVLINLVTNHGYLSILPDSSMRRLKDPPGLIPLGPGTNQTLTLVWLKDPLSRRIAEAMLALMHEDGTAAPHARFQETPASHSPESRKPGSSTNV